MRQFKPGGAPLLLLTYEMCINQSFNDYVPHTTASGRFAQHLESDALGGNQLFSDPIAKLPLASSSFFCDPLHCFGKVVSKR